VQSGLTDFPGFQVVRLLAAATFAKEAWDGVTAMDTRAGWPTIKVAWPVMDPEAALMVAVPALSPLPNPVTLTEAIAGAEEVHTTELLRFFMVPSV